MQEKFLTLCIDLETFGLPEEFGPDIPKDDKYEISLQGLKPLREVLGEFHIKATFFVTKDMAGMFPGEIGRLALDGHEIALHSVVGRQEEKKVIRELREQKSFIENVIDGKILGHRSHKLLPISLRELKEAGLLYDNSLHPTYVPGRYCNILSRREFYKQHGMVEVPVTVTPLFRFPFSWLWFRTFGASYAKLCSRFTYLIDDYINIYFHPWDFANISDITLRWPYRLLTYNSGDRMLFNFRRFLKWATSREVCVITMSNYVHNQLAKEIQLKERDDGP